MARLAPAPAPSPQGGGGLPGPSSVSRRAVRVEVDSDLARLLVDDLARESNAPPVYTRGQLYQYRATGPQVGLWAAWSPDDLRLRLQTYHRNIRVPGRRAPDLLVHRQLQEAAAAVTSTLCHNPTFLDGAPSGVTFSDAFVHVCRDGIFERPHDPDNRSTFGYPFSFGEAKGEPAAFLGFLRQVWAPDEDREAKINALRQFLAANLLGVAPRFQQCVVLHGPKGSNGKSTLQNILLQLFPPESVRSIKPQTWTDEYYAAELSGARINVVGEMPEAQIAESSTFKAVITGDKITGRVIHQRPFDFKPQAGHLFSCNTLPGTTDCTDAFFRRFLILGFNRIFDGSTPEEDILEAIRPDLPRVVRWALEAAPELLRRNRYAAPPSSLAAIGAWRSASNPALGFVATCTKPGGSTPVKAAYQAYCTFSKTAGLSPLTMAGFSKKLSNGDIESRRGKTGYVYPFALKPEKDWEYR